MNNFSTNFSSSISAAISSDSSVLNKFKAGFNECATEVSRYVSRIEGVDPALRQRLLSHLSNCLASMNSTAPFQQQQQQQASNLSFGNTFPGMLQSLSVQIPAGISTVGIVPASRSSTNGDINNNTSPTTGSNGKLFAGLSVIPSRLPNGDFAFLLPSQALTTSGSMSFHLPSVSASSSLPSSSGPDRNSQSSWPPTSPSSKRSPSPDAMSEDNVVLSPTCSDAGSDVFLEPSYKHHHSVKEMVISPPPHHIERSSPIKERHSIHHFPRHHQVSEAESVWRPW